MGKKLYTLFMIVVPLFVGSGGLYELIVWKAGLTIHMSPWLAGAFFLVGYLTGIREILDLMKRAEGTMSNKD